MLDVNSLMTAFDNFVTKVREGTGGVPLNYYLRPVTAPQLAQILFVQAKLPAPSAATQTALGEGGAKVAVRENVGQSHFAIITPGNPAYTANEAAMLAVMTGGE